MKNKRFKETLDLAWGVDTFVLEGKKGTLIYKEERDNHIPGMMLVTNGGEFPLEKHDYLVFEIKDHIDYRILKNVHHHHGIVVTKTDYGTEVACHHPQVFHNGTLFKLEELGFIKRTWKTSSKEEGEYPGYVDAKGWQIVYNLGSILLTLIHKRLLLIKKKWQLKKEL